MTVDFKKIAVLGAGLLGGSIGMAVYRKWPHTPIAVWARRAEVRAVCEAADWCSSAPVTPEEACRDADLVIACTPVDHIPDLLKTVAKGLPTGAIVTDVGSTKVQICREGSRLFPGGSGRAVFIGSHPMAGSEKAGISHADANLFQGHPCILTPTPEMSDRQALERLRGFWKGLGMVVHECTPARHDQIIASVSHLPHAAAASLCALISDESAELLDFAGSGFRDSTRIASGDPALWAAIFLGNQQEVCRATAALEAKLAHFRSLVERGDRKKLQCFLREAKVLRDQFSSR